MGRAGHFGQWARTTVPGLRIDLGIKFDFEIQKSIEIHINTIKIQTKFCVNP
jgi:hypothetical protein